MTGQLLVMALAGVLLGLCGGYPWGRWNGVRALDAAYEAGRDDLHDEIWGDAEPAEFDRSRTAVVIPREQDEAWQEMVALGQEIEELPHTPSAAERAAMLASLAPEALQDSAALQLDEGSQRDVPEPARSDVDGTSFRGDSGGLGHPSPYTGTPTPAQRRRDKHKQRGPWAPGDLPDPPTDVGAWWQGELEALLRDGQSEWLTRNLEAVA